MDRARLWAEVADGTRSVAELVDVDPRDLARVETLGIAAFSQGKFDRAISIFSGLIDLEPTKPEHVLHLAHSLVQAGHPGPAIEAFSRFFELAEGRFERREMVRARLSRGLLLVGRNDYETAQADFAAARTLAAGDAALVALVDQHAKVEP